MVGKTKSNQCVSMATIQMEEQWKPKTKRMCACVCECVWRGGVYRVLSVLHAKDFKLFKKII